MMIIKKWLDKWFWAKPKKRVAEQPVRWLSAEERERIYERNLAYHKHLAEQIKINGGRRLRCVN